MGANSYIYSLVDGLNLTYSGNQLVSVSDAATGPNYAGAFHFIDGSSSAVEYEYDENGNMTRDLNKGIVSIEYNLLNLPQRVTLSTGDTARYVYDADGIKLSASYFTAMGGGVTGTYDTLNYCGNVIYRNGQLEQLLFDGGFITLSGTGTPQYHFYQCDHLGSVRTVTSQDGTIEHTNDYYPFGALFSVNPADNLQRWKYNGKELERMHGMNLMDYGARMYDPLLVRFTTMDPMCEKYYNVSPYAYCANNPVNAIDIDGRFISYFDRMSKGKYVYSKGDFYENSLKKINGHRIPTTKVEPVNEYMSRILNALRKMEKSKDKRIQKVFSTLSDLDSNIDHNIRVVFNRTSTEPYGYDGASIIKINFNEDIDNGDFKGIGLTDYELVGHELKHAYDMHFKNNNQKTDSKGIRISEYETVNFENLIRKEEDRPLRTSYKYKIPDELWEKVTIWN